VCRIIKYIHQEIEQVLKHQKHKRSLKDYGRISEERSTISQHIGSEEKDTSQRLETSLIRLCRDHQTQKTLPDSKDPFRLGRPSDFRRT